MHPVLFSSASDRWYTPAEVLAVARQVLGAIDLDPASDDDAQARVRAERYYTPADDGLTRPWAGRVFVNPPYSAVAAWAERFAVAAATSEIAAGLLLVPARVDTGWWQRVAHLPWCAWRGRLRFSEAETGATFPSALIYAGPDLDGFAAAVEPHGVVYVPRRPAAPRVLQLPMVAA